jgi:signal transduction histidine kinase
MWGDERQQRRLLELINSILDMAKIESGRLQIEQVEFDLSELIDRTLRLNASLRSPSCAARSWLIK